MTPETTTTSLSETDQIAVSLDQVFVAIFDEFERREPPTRAALSARESAWELIDRMERFTAAQERAHTLVEAPTGPVGEALRQVITTLGQRLFEIGGVKLMQDVLYRVAAQDPATEAKRIGIMDRRWDGIGRTPSSPGWCS